MLPNTTQIKCVLLGDSGVGKSSIVLRFIADTFHNDLEATIGASYLYKTIEIENKSIKFNIWDTAGQERYHALSRIYYTDAAAAIIVYDITSKKSYDAMKNWYKELKENGPKDIIIAIAGNKEDLIENEEIDTDEAKEFAKSIGAIFKKTSAKTKYGVENIFREIGLRLNTFDKTNEGITLTKKETAKSKGCC